MCIRRFRQSFKRPTYKDLWLISKRGCLGICGTDAISRSCIVPLEKSYVTCGPYEAIPIHIDKNVSRSRIIFRSPFTIVFLFVPYAVGLNRDLALIFSPYR